MDEQSKAVHAARRAQLARQLGAGGVAVLPTAPEQSRNRDSGFPFRHDSYFYYLTGFTEPNAWLVITAEGRSTLICQPKDLEREIWDGYRLGPEAAPAALGLDAAHSVAELNTLMPQLLENRASVWFPFATHDGLAAQVEGWLGQVRSRVRMGAQCPQSQQDLCALLDEMRLFKDASELATMRRAAQISARAHVRAMQTSARLLRAGEDAREYHLEAELLLIDAGCELDGYASDITRTFPANGRFTPEQRALYDIVLAAQEASAAATKPGARFNDPHLAAVRVLSQGLLDEGLLKKDLVGTLDDVIEKRAYFRFYMHRTSHWLGMDVHACGSYVEPSEAHQLTSRTDPISGLTVQEQPSRILRPGMVLTLEPGLYVRPADDVPERFWHIGIRIEDDAVVTETGCELITRDVPVRAEEIEALMR